MVEQELQTQMGERLKADLLKAWQSGHGGAAETVHLMQGEEGLALLIPKGLLKAEMDLTRKSGAGSRVLNQYLRELLLLVSADLVSQVEALTHRRVEEVVPLVDLRAGWLITFFRFETLRS